VLIGVATEPVLYRWLACNGLASRPAIHPKWMHQPGRHRWWNWHVVSTILGVECQPNSWVALVFGYKALGSDVGSDTDDHAVQRYDVVYYGPVFGLNLH
jgi:hypothetical protein